MDRVAFRLDDDDARRFFEYAGYRARNTREPLKRAGRTLLHHINMTFATEGEWIGHPWPGLSKGYERWKAEHYPGRPMLVAEGHLRSAAIGERSLRVSDNELRWSINVPYAQIMQEGQERIEVTHKGEPYTVTIPARPFVEVTPELTEAIENDFRVWLNELKALNRARRSVAMPNPFD